MHPRPDQRGDPGDLLQAPVAVQATDTDPGTFQGAGRPRGHRFPAQLVEAASGSLHDHRTTEGQVAEVETIVFLHDSLLEKNAQS
ncbi:MAG: hypothetical protein Q4F02_03415 [Candidatus Saccharibacteria bacterium]|nr:hypothetical protein [Candidatus Saccharibacteria bacterium]